MFFTPEHRTRTFFRFFIRLQSLVRICAQRIVAVLSLKGSFPPEHRVRKRNNEKKFYFSRLTLHLELEDSSFPSP